MEDNDILDLYFARSEDAICQTDAAYGRKLFCLADRILHDAQDSEESVSDTYMKAWETIPPKRPACFYAYLAKICRFFALGKLDWKAAAKRKAEVVSLTDEMALCIPDQRKEAEFEDSMELLTEPITMQSLAGYVSDATGDMDPLYEYFTITSAILHPEGLALVGTHALIFLRNRPLLG